MFRSRRLLRLLILVAVCAALGLGSVAQAAEPVTGVTFVKITQNGQVVDSLFGVEARYNLGGYETLWCSDYVIRYYETLYGLDIYLSNDGPVVRGTDEYWFEKLDADAQPQTGDVMYGAAALRGKSYNHWAIVKSYDQYHGRLNIIEQNWRWNGCAGVGRTLDYPTKYYYLYRLCSADGPVSPDVPEQDLPSSEAAAQAADTASRLGIATVADGFRTAIDAGSFFTLCCNTIRAATGYDTYAEPADPVDAAERLGLVSQDVWQAADRVTREQAAVILCRLAKLLAAQPEAELSVLSLYEDRCDIGTDYRPWVAQATALGLMQADAGASFHPQQALTWEQALVALTDLAQQPQRELCAAAPETEADAQPQQPQPPQQPEVAAGAIAADAAASHVGSLIRQ